MTTLDQHFYHTVLNVPRYKLLNVYSLLSTVNQLVLIGAFVACLHTSVSPQLISVVVKLLVIASFKHIRMHTINRT